MIAGKRGLSDVETKGNILSMRLCALESHLIVYILFVVGLLSVVPGFCNTADAAQALRLDLGGKSYNLQQYMDVLEDREGQLTIEQVASDDYFGNFHPLKVSTINLGMHNSVYWFRFRLACPDRPELSIFDTQPRWILNVGTSSLIESISFFRSFPKNTSSGQKGNLLIEQGGVYFSKMPIFNIPVCQGEIATYYLRIQSRTGLLLPIHIFSHEYSTRLTRMRVYTYGVYYGLMLAMVFYHLLLFLLQRTARYYLWFACYGASIVLYFAFLNGLIQSIAPALEMKTLFVFLGSYLFWLILFAKGFLDTADTAPKLDFTLKLLLAITLVFILLTGVADWYWLNKYSMAIGIPTHAVILYAGIYRWAQGFRPARYFMIASVVMLIGGLFYALIYAGLLPFQNLTYYSFQIGSALGAILLSIAVADQISRLRREREEADRQLILHQHAEYSAVKSYERLTAILDSLDALVVVIDFESEDCLFQNHAARESFGELVGKPFWDSIRHGMKLPEDFPSLTDLLGEKGQKQEVHIWESHYAATDSHYEFRDRAIRWVDGRVVRLIIALDISEKKLAAQERQRIMSHLMESQRTESLAHMAGGIAHDFNNLLTSIIGNISLVLLDIPKDDPHVDSLRDVEDAAQQASVLSRQMLAYSGKGHFMLRTIDLSEAISDITALCYTSISYNISLHFHLSEQLPLIEAEISQIQQVIMNLLTNAEEAIGESEGEITISTGSMYCDQECLDQMFLGSDRHQGEYVYLRIDDSGCGMSEETRCRIFDPFFTTKFTGRGLGLAAVMGIMRGHNGAIGVQSEPAKGSVFTLLFPVSKKPSTDEMPAFSEDYYHQATETILVVDDEELIRKLAKKALERSGYEVILAENGLEALSIFRNEKDSIDMIVLDLMMPHMTGAEVFGQIKMLRPDIPVLVISGYGEDVIEKHFNGGSLAGFIQKPFEPETLLAAVGHLLKEQADNGNST